MSELKHYKMTINLAIDPTKAGLEFVKSLLQDDIITDLKDYHAVVMISGKLEEVEL